MIRGTKREISTTPNNQFNVSTSIHNRFDIEVVDSVSGKVKQKAYAENVICDGLWTRLLSGLSYNNCIHYGEGSGTPSQSDTSLFSFISYKVGSFIEAKYDYETCVYSVIRKASISETDAVGKTITEVGIAYGSDPTNLCTHAMLRDMNGNPVSLLKTNTDIFNIYATVFVHLVAPSGARYLGTTIGGKPSVNNVDNFYLKTNYYPGILAYIAGICSKPDLYMFLSGGYCVTKSPVSTLASVSYDTSNRTLTVTCPRLAAANHNVFRGIKNIFLGTKTGYYEFYALDFNFEIDENSPWYSKTVIQNESIGTGDGVTTDFSTKINFAKNVIVKVDGSPVNATTEFSCARNIGHYLRPIRLPVPGIIMYNNAYHLDHGMYYDPDNDKIYLNRFEADDLSLRPVYENILYETHGISKLSGSYKYVAVSNDLINWIELGEVTTIPEEYRNYRYWSVYTRSRGPSSCTFTSNKSLPTETNIHLDEAPPEGAVITADYDAICVGKDENHVFDFSVVFSFNEYTES